jgi:molybdate transport system substrate-binding protein
VVADYPIAALRTGAQPAAAQAFVAFATGGEGRAILAAHGFGLP